jgi:uncharacterized membrane protein
MAPSTRPVRSLSLVTVYLSVVALCLSLLVVMPRAMAKATNDNRPGVTEEKVGKITYQVSRILVNAPIDDVWTYINDCKNAPSIFPTVKKCKLVEDKGATRVVYMFIHPSDCPFTYEYTVECHNDKAKGYSEWHRISGDFKAIDGFWRLEPKDNGHSTLVTYAQFVDGGFLTPQILIKRQSGMDVPTNLLALKAHAEAKTEVAGRLNAGKSE